MLALLATAFLSGLLGSLHCVAMCGAFAASCGSRRGGLPLWHTGRLLSYGLLGAIAASFGALLPGPAWIPALIATLFLLWFALALAGLVRDLPVLPGPFERAAKRALASPTSASQFAFGLVNGLLPCGLVYAALSIPIAMKQPLTGTLLMLSFGLGTVPALTAAAAGIHRALLTSLFRRRLLAAILLLAGLWAIWTRATTPPDRHQHEHTAANAVVMTGIC